MSFKYTVTEERPYSADDRGEHYAEDTADQAAVRFAELTGCSSERAEEVEQLLNEGGTACQTDPETGAEVTATRARVKA